MNNDSDFRTLLLALVLVCLALAFSAAAHCEMVIHRELCVAAGGR